MLPSRAKGRWTRLAPMTTTSSNETSVEYLVSIFYQWQPLPKRRFDRLRRMFGRSQAD